MRQCDQELDAARALYLRAKKELAKSELESAEQLLGDCIKKADAPACHLLLATALSLRQHPSARAHLDRYLLLEPDPRARAMIRAFVN